MSEEVVRDVEQITKTPVQEIVKKEKDPKKVAAGKKLAEHNRRAKEALKREMKREEEEREMKREANDEEERETQAWFPEMSFTTVVSIVGIGLTAINMFMSYRTPKVMSYRTPKVMSEPPQVSNRVTEPEPHATDRPASKIPKPTHRIGMS